MATQKLSIALAALATPSFTNRLTMTGGMTLGAVSVTTTGTQLNYLSAVTGTSGTTTSNVVFSASPTFTGTVTTPILKVTTGAAAGRILISDASGNLSYLAAGAATEMLVGNGAANPVWTTATGTGAPVRAISPTFTGTPTLPVSTWKIGAVTVTTTGTRLNYLTSATGTTGTASSNIVFSASPTLTGTPKTERIESVTAFSTGYDKNGYQVIETGGVSTLEIDNVIVRDTLSANEFEIQRITSIAGTQIISVANGIIYDVSGTNLIFDEDGGQNPIIFAVGDYVMAQNYTGRNTGSYKGLVTVVTHSATLGSAYITCTTVSGTAVAGMQLVQIGNNADSARRSIIRSTASETNNPFIEGFAGVDDGTFSAGDRKFRLGNLTGITDAQFGALSGFGLWSDTAYLTGSINATAGLIGGFTINSTDGIYSGADATRVQMKVGAGFWAGATAQGSAPFRVTAAGALTATSATITGTVTATAGAIGGWTLGATSLSGGSVILSSTGVISAGTGNDIAIMSATDATYRLWIGNATAAAAPFRVTKAGATYVNSLYLNSLGGGIYYARLPMVQVSGKAVIDSPLELTVNTYTSDYDMRCLNSGAFSVPKLTNTQINAMTKTAGMIVYDTTNNLFYGYTTSWRQLNN